MKPVRFAPSTSNSNLERLKNKMPLCNFTFYSIFFEQFQQLPIFPLPFTRVGILWCNKFGRARDIVHEKVGAARVCASKVKSKIGYYRCYEYIKLFISLHY